MLRNLSLVALAVDFGLVLEGVNGLNGAVGPVLMFSGVIPGDAFFVVADDRGDGASDVPGA
jgi:hypothetical protein